MSTGIVIPVKRLDYSDEAKLYAEAYFPSSYLFLKETLSDGPLDCYDQIFVDFGCGMGRALLFASTLPFKRIIGVELSNSLCKTARQNLAKFYANEQKLRPEWSVINADVRSFLIPNDATVFYMMNPFNAVVMKVVLDNIETSLRTAPRRGHLVYANPQHGTLLDRPGFKKMSESNCDYAIYSIAF